MIPSQTAFLIYYRNPYPAQNRPLSVLRLISKYCHKKGVFEEKRVLLRTIPFSYQDYCVFTIQKVS